MTRFPMRDALATLFVAVAVVIVGAWTLGAAVPGFGSVGAVTVAVLVLGVAASMSAVVPGWDSLIHGSRIYFAAASALGVVALGAGIWAIMADEGVAVGLLIAATLVLWAMSTMRHMGVQLPQQRLGHR